MKYKMFALILALAVATWAQTSTQTTPATPQQSTVPADKAKCACCDKMAAADAKDAPACCARHDTKAADGKEMSCCAGKDAKSSGKDAMACMKNSKNKAASCCKDGCTKDSCGKDKTAAACCAGKCSKDEKSCSGAKVEKVREEDRKELLR
ncbi:MAG TPA: hypothetical protein VKF84_02265 [Candidatus Sulfotelmatobacter sp.]|nr:hypothetical protein [Candidatus Sulfotelmatobacter sp.]